MSPNSKIKELVLIGGLILTLVVSVVLFSSKRNLSVTPSQASGNTDIFNITPSNPTSTPSPSPTLLRVMSQDVPLKVLGSKQEAREPSYLYTELTSKGLVSNITSNSVTILWLTEAPQQTTLRYGLKENQLNRKFTGLAPVYIHEAKLENLSPSTLFYYTGHAPIIDSFTSAPVLPTPPFAQKVTGSVSGGSGSCLIRGIVFNEDETSAYATVISNTADWALPLTGLRTADYSKYFSMKSTDELEVDALCVSSGKVLYSGSKKLTFGTSLKEKINIKLRQDN